MQIIDLLEKYQSAFNAYADAFAKVSEARKTVACSFAVAGPIMEVLAHEIRQAISATQDKLARSSRWALIATIGYSVSRLTLIT